jgi:hypothetical protein
MATLEGRSEALDHIIKTEVNAINRRRRAGNRSEVSVSETGPGSPVLEVVGLALSGGGIRSASFSLGVLQALNEKKALDRIDYLSTVSGGGYMGSALSATMTKSKGAFEFGQTTGGRKTKPELTDVKDTPPVGHLRNYSNYLIPFGIRDLLTALAIVFRGLVANVSLALPIILLFATATIFLNPDRTDLTKPNLIGFPLTWLGKTNFGVTLLLALAAFPIFFLWAAWRSLSSQDNQGEFRTWLPSLAAGYLVLVAGVFFCELQPYLVAGMFDLADEANKRTDSDHSLLTAFITRLAAIAAPVAAVVTVFRQQVGTLLVSVTKASGMTTKLMAYGAHAAIWIAGAALPLLIWVGYLYLCYWGIINNKPVAKLEPRPAAIHGTIQIQGPGVDLRGTVDCRPSAQNPCGPQSAPDDAQDLPDDDGPCCAHTPRWLINTAAVIDKFYQKIIPTSWQDVGWLNKRLFDRPVTLLYATLGLLLLVLGWTLMPNANSLHRLYRDRLSKAFLFDPDRARRGAATKGHMIDSVDLGRDFAPLDTVKISELVPKKKEEPPYAPYHLINAALNVQGSDFANRRGRNADFFLFSPRFVGSEVTGYADTSDVEKATGLDLPTAMAISGAAFSSNMGANSIRALTPTLALLNVRTGYWLKNPLTITPRPIGAEKKHVKKRVGSKSYLWSEITGRLYEDSEDIYITDGGHIENLGIYELLRRRCKIVIVVDAEADPAMRMPSFIALQRYARIDLGVRINMPWDGMRKSTICWMGYGGTTPAKDDKPPTPTCGPHTAIGTINYDGGESGWLLYIKSSLSGDENDYVRDYARRYSEFPHESTGDQFFSEEQFEVYRALGFHIVSRLLNGEDELQVCGIDQLARIGAVDPNVTPIREALLGELSPASSSAS